MEPESFISDEDFKQIMDDYEEECKKIRDEENRINGRILRAIKNVKGKKFYDSLMIAMEEDEILGKLEIVRKPIGKYQTESWGVIKGSWVDQYTQGEDGDSFYGTVCIQLKKDKYLLMPFSC